MIEINYGAILFSLFASSCTYLSIAFTMSEINAKIDDTRFTKKASQEIRDWNRYFEAGIRRLRVQERCGRLRDAVEELSSEYIVIDTVVGGKTLELTTLAKDRFSGTQRPPQGKENLQELRLSSEPNQIK